MAKKQWTGYNRYKYLSANLTKKMNVEFNENRPLMDYQEKKGGLTAMLIKLGLAKDEKGAQKVMLIITTICFVLAIYFFMKI